MKKELFLSIFIFLFILTITGVVIFYGKGYRFEFDNGKPELSGTGLLVATSTPDGAEVKINGHLTTATNNTINLFPGEYDIVISKDGYFPWEKKIRIDKEVVAKAEALLLPTAPKLENITLTGVSNPVIDPSFTKIAYTVASESAVIKNGIYILNMNGQSFLPLSGGSSQIASDGQPDLFSQAQLSWSPDGQNLLATISAQRQTPSTYLLSASGFNQSPQDVTETLSQVQTQWQKQQQEKDNTLVNTLKPTLGSFILSDAKILAWSPDETKIVYQATTSATMPIIITPRHIGADSIPEVRTIQTGNVYTYDTKDDRNYLLETNDKKIGIDYTLTWFPDNIHLIKIHDKKIDLVEYDNTNETTIYAGPFINTYAFPWPNGSRVVILTNFATPDQDPHMYTIDLK